MCKEITNFSTLYFSRANNVNAATTQYHVVRDVPLSRSNLCARSFVLALYVSIRGPYGSQEGLCTQSRAS
jgi:hypothetical protein